MPEPTLFNQADTSMPRLPADGEAARPIHDRELPVSAESDLVSAHRAHDVDPTATPPSETPDPSATEAPSAVPDAGDDALNEDLVKLALRRVKDPELNLNILDLGLVYEIRVDGNNVAIDMTLTSPGCPSGPEIMTDAERHLRALPGVGDVAVNLVWSPFWSPERIEPRVRAYLGF